MCVCNATYCDNFDDVLTPSAQDQVVVVTSGIVRNKNRSENLSLINTAAINYFQTGPRFVVTHETLAKYDQQPIKFAGSQRVINSKIRVNQKSKFQKIVGFGGAHTGTVTLLLQQLPQAVQDYIYESYYSATEGIGYTITRVPIGGSDFDMAPWAYNESPVDDKALSNFTKLDQRDWDRVSQNQSTFINQHDNVLLFLQIEQIERMKLVSGQEDIKFYGSAWSAPKWIKSNNDWHGASEVLPEYYDTWADYHVR